MTRRRLFARGAAIVAALAVVPVAQRASAERIGTTVQPRCDRNAIVFVRRYSHSIDAPRETV